MPSSCQSFILSRRQADAEAQHVGGKAAADSARWLAIAGCGGHCSLVALHRNHLPLRSMTPDTDGPAAP